MKAVVFGKYGQPDVLRLEDIEKPALKDNEVLVKVRASSINDWDWGLLRGKPFFNRVAFGFFKPRTIIAHHFYPGPHVPSGPGHVWATL